MNSIFDDECGNKRIWLKDFRYKILQSEIICLVMLYSFVAFMSKGASCWCCSSSHSKRLVS